MNIKLKRTFLVFSFVVLSVFLILLVSSRTSEHSALSQFADSGYTLGVDNDTNNISQYAVTPTPSMTVAPTVFKPDIDINSWEFILANEDNNIGSYAPPSVAVIEGTAQYFDDRALSQLNSFILAMYTAGYTPYIQQGYVAYSTQNYRFNGKASQICWPNTDAESYAAAVERAKEIIAYPGTSDHQTGLGLDITDKYYSSLDPDTVDSGFMEWLRENCAQYGFIPRYPSGKSGITGWDEPWHYRYVGVEAAQFIVDNNLCLEQFRDLYT